MVNEEYKKLIENMNCALSEKNPSKIQEFSSDLLSMPKDELSNQIKMFYNDGAYNPDQGGGGIKKYLDASLIREILQNIIDCDYSKNINIAISTNDEDCSITFKYNEDGFKISNLIAFFSLNHTSKSKNSTGAFGIGAKGAILSAERAIVKSTFSKDEDLSMNMEFEIKTVKRSEKDTLNIEKLNISDVKKGQICNGTEFCLYLDHTLYSNIVRNLNDLDGSENKTKGKFLNPFDLMFASLKKKGKLITINFDTKTCELEASNNNVSFIYNNCSSDFSVFEGEKSHFQYLIPYSFGYGEKPQYVSAFSYNYFSTYELTGRSDDTSNSSLPKFYINIPTKNCNYPDGSDNCNFITDDRSGIESRNAYIIDQYVLYDVNTMIEKFGKEQELYFDSNEKPSLTAECLYNYIKFMKESGSNLLKNFISYTGIYLNHDFISLNEFKYYDGCYSGNHLVDEKIKELKRSKKGKYIFRVYDLLDLLLEKNGIIRKRTYNYKIIVNGKMIEFSVGRKKEKYTSDLTMANQILSQKTYLDTVILLLPLIENDEEFTEETLLKVFNIVSHTSMKYSFDNDEKAFIVYDHRYIFTDKFKVSCIETLEQCPRKEKDLFLFLKEKFLINFKANYANANIIEQIKAYKALGFYIKYNYSNPKILDVILRNENSLVDVESIDISSVTGYYGIKQIAEIVGCTNYKLLIGQKAAEFISSYSSIADVYNFNTEDINRVCGIKNANLIDNIFMVKSNMTLDVNKENFVATIKNEIITKIVQFNSDNIKNIKIDPDTETLAIILEDYNKLKSKGTAKRVCEFLDLLFNTGTSIKNMYAPIKTPAVILRDQFSYNLKPCQSVSKDEFLLLCKYFSANNGMKLDDKSKEHTKLMLAKDVNTKLYGYSGSCSICTFESEILNAFYVKQFEFFVSRLGKKYTVFLYLCANHFYESEGFCISEVLFWNGEDYLISFDEWLKYIKENECIPAKFLKCKINVFQHSTYSFADFAGDDEIQNQTSKEKSYEIILTPLMATKWYKDNSDGDAFTYHR